MTPGSVFHFSQWPALREHRQALGADSLLVICLCAEWCSVCREFKPTLEACAGSHPDIAFAYLDIEDDSDLIGALDLDNFPTLAIFRGSALLHFGVVKARRDSIDQLLRSLAEASPLKPPAVLRTLCDAIS